MLWARGDVSKPYIPVGLGAAFVFMGVAVMGPALARPASWAIGWPLTKTLWDDRASSSRKRSAQSSTHLCYGSRTDGGRCCRGPFFSLFYFLSSLATKSVEKAFAGDFIVQRSDGWQRFHHSIRRRTAKAARIELVAAERDTPVRSDGKTQYVAAVDFDVFPKVINLPTKSGSLARAGVNSLATTQKIADEKKWVVGQTVKAQFSDGPAQELTLVATYIDNVGFLNYIVPIAAYERSGAEQTDTALFVNKARASAPMRPARQSSL